MLTKTIKFDDDVLEVLKSMEWYNDGFLGLFPEEKLERDLYMRCNKAFDALGGKWNRKLGGIVFQIDPRPRIEGLIESGSLTVERDGFFETPRAVVEHMLELVPPDTSNDALTLEPSAGLGAIVRILIEHGVQWMLLIEKNEDRAFELRKEFLSQCRFVECKDFLMEPVVTGYPFDRIYMNPPFEELQDVDHVKHAYDFLAFGGKMVSVMSRSVFFRRDKKAIEFREWFENVGGYSEKLPDGAFKESGTGVNARLVVIQK